MTRSVEEKLGLKPGMRTALAGLPPGVAAILPAALAARGDPPDWLIGFAPDQAALFGLCGTLVPRYRRGGHLWLCYPKGSSGLSTDLSRDRGWEPLSALDLLPVTQIAVDATWSALRWRYRDEIARITRSF